VTRFAIVGGSGYVGGELLRLAASHPELELTVAIAHSNVGERISKVHPHLMHLADHKFESLESDSLREAEVVFLALPHGKSAEVAKVLSVDQLVIDSGADYRLIESADWIRHYGGEHAGTWAYGLPELTLGDGRKQRENLRRIGRIAAPGCNVTAITLALAPGYSENLFGGAVHCVLAVGTSGAGRALRTNLLASEVMGAATAYSVAGSHRHNPEIVQNLKLAGAVDPEVNFTPILVPMSRGILAVNQVKVQSGVTLERLRAAYQRAYGEERFIQVLPLGEQPSTKSVLGSNYAQIAIELDEITQVATITSAIDNLVKGTAGAAIQSMNLALGFDEAAGLTSIGVAP